MFFNKKGGNAFMGRSNKYKWWILVFESSKRISDEVWKKLTASLVGNTLTSNIDYMKSITGISISPKISNCVMKILNSNSNLNECDLFTKEIDYLNQDIIRYNNITLNRYNV